MLENFEELTWVSQKVQKIECLKWEERNQIKQILEGAAKRIAMGIVNKPEPNGGNKPRVIVKKPFIHQPQYEAAMQEYTGPEAHKHPVSERKVQNRAVSVLKWIQSHPGSTIDEYMKDTGVSAYPYSVIQKLLSEGWIEISGMIGKVPMYRVTAKCEEATSEDN